MSMRPANTDELNTGYALTNWRHALEAVNKAFARYTMDSFQSAEDNLTLVEQKALGQQFSEAKSLMFDACKAPHAIGMAHNSARQVIKAAGVKTITNEDFEGVAETFDYSQLGEYGADIRSDDEGYYLRIPIGGGGCR
jgi:hypothetical protein